MFVSAARAPLVLRADKLSFDERVEITRGLMAEYAKSKVTLPRAKKPLVFQSDGQYNKEDGKRICLNLVPPPAWAMRCRLLTY